jgi:hypothetical protein
MKDLKVLLHCEEYTDVDAVIASERIMQVAIRAFEAAMCNYTSATDGRGRTVEMHEVTYAVVCAVEDKVHSITKGGDK